MLPNQLSKCVLIVAVIGILQTSVDSLELTEAEQIALEVSGVMLPPKKLSRKIAEDLKAIRQLYPEMKEIHHTPKWAAGELIVSRADDKTIQNINTSRYGPVKVSDTVGIKSSDVGEGQMYKLMFSKPYHPARLVERMQSELGIKEVEANLKFGNTQDVSFHATAPLYNTYTFKMGWGDCTSECIYNHYWEFSVAPSKETLTVKLEKEYGSDLALRNL